MGLSQKDREKVDEALRKNLSHTNDGLNGLGVDPVDEQTCAKIRRLAADGVRPADIARRDDIDIARESLNFHIRGECGHDVEVDAR
jgi:hypothetical protein